MELSKFVAPLNLMLSIYKKPLECVKLELTRLTSSRIGYFFIYYRLLLILCEMKESR